MATNNDTFCSKINGKVGNNGFKPYCIERGGLTVLDPAGAVANDGVNQENLIIYATLRANVKQKSLVYSVPDEKVLEVNFLKGKETNVGEAPENTSFLTTNWTDIGSIDSKLGEDLETFGMTQIDINLKPAIWPIITIDFEDIRGATLFEQGTCSPYAAFFLQPYPVFELTVKGYYGDPIVYWLSVKSFTTSFDSGTGNYKSRAEFYAYSYAFLSDILLGYVMAAPYMEGSDAVLASIYNNYLKYYKERGYNEGKTKFNPLTANNGRPMTIYDYVKKLQELTGQGNSDEGAIAEIQNSTELFEVEKLDDLSSTLSRLEESLIDFKKEWETLGGTVDENLLTYGVGNGGDTGVLTTKLNELYNTYFGATGQAYISVDFFNEQITENNITDITTFEPITDLRETSSDFLLKINLEPLQNSTNTKRSEIVSVSQKSKEKFKQAANDKIKAAIGFIPTIRSFFTTLVANTDLFLELLRKVSIEAERFHENVESDTYRFRGVEGKRVSDTVFAWPSFVQLKTVDGVEKEVEVYPGVDPRAANWPEVKFVEDFLKAYIEMQKDIEGAVNEDNPEIDPYDNIPGRDNYVPVNAMETPAGTKECNNSYYNLADLDSLYKALGERFITLTNFTSANSNYINTSIIAAANTNTYDVVGGRNPQNAYQTDIQSESSPYEKKAFPIYDRIQYAGTTPYFSAGVPFVPPQWGGQFGSQRANNGILGYPYYLPDSEYYPMGLYGSSVNVSDRNFKRNVGKNSFIDEIIYDDGEVQAVLGDVSEITTSAEDRVYYLNKDGSPTDSSVLDQILDDNGDTDLFIISEPKYYTKTIIYFWSGLESVISRKSQFNQIPQDVKDKAFIVMAAGTTSDKQNSLEDLKTAFTNFYSKDINTRKLSSSNTDNIVTVDFSDEFNTTYSNIFIGYSAGGKAISKNTTSGGKIGLIDPSLDTTQVNNNNKWQNTFMLWGSSGMISLFGGDNSPNNYEDLQSTIISNGGKSEKVNGLDHGTAISSWFTKYSEDIVGSLSLNETIIKLDSSAEKNEISEVNDKKLMYNSAEESVKPSNFDSFYLDNGTSTAWEFLGRIEAQNVYNSIENTKLLGSIINNTSNYKELQERIIEILGISGNDIYEDQKNEAYRYDKSIVLNRVGRSNGGPVTLTPDIHTMRGEDLVRLNRFDNAIQNGFDVKGSGTSILNNWRNKVSGRKGFALSPDSTWLKSSAINDYLNQRYGIKWKDSGGSVLIGVDGSSFTVNEEFRIVDLDGSNRTPIQISDQKTNNFLPTNLVGYYFNGLGLYFPGTLVKFRGGFTSDTGIKDDDGKSSIISVWQYNNYTNSNPSILDKFLNVDIFPDRQFDYDSWPKVFNKAKWGGDFPYRYSLDLTEYQNEAQKKGRKKWEKGKFETPIWGWYSSNFNSKDSTEYSIDLLELNTGSLPKTKFTHYSLGFVDSNFTPNDYVNELNRRGNPIVDTPASANQLAQQAASFSPTFAIPPNGPGSGSAIVIQPSNQPSQFWANLRNVVVDQIEEAENTISPTQDYAKLNLKESYGFGLQGSILPKASTDQFKLKDFVHNSNSENLSNSITDTPFWKHNFPADEVDSNIRKEYYSFFGGGFMNQKEENLDIPSKKPFYMGVQNDLDSWANTSKYFPVGYSDKRNTNEYVTDWNYTGDLNKSDIGQPTSRKGVLTKHNQGVFSIIRNDDGNIISDTPDTAYNKTKAWKGSLGYLFLANQYHKPWTGLYSSSLKNLGQQGVLSLTSTSIELPRHSILMLGSVLWRMREAGLLESDDPKWNLSPQITNGIDPVNFPLIPNKVKIPINEGAGLFKNLDFRNWVFSETYESNNDELPINDGTYPTNYGLRPPTASFISQINRNKDGWDSIACFPEADEWPVVNTGMIHAYDFFGDKGVENPFKNQYKIFTPVFANNNARFLRYTNQSIRYTTSIDQVTALEKSLNESVESELQLLKDYSESAKTKITQELTDTASKTYDAEIKKLQDEANNTLVGKLQNNKYLGGSEEGFTRFSILTHHQGDTFYRLGSVDLTQASIINSDVDYSILENGRNGIYKQSEEKRATNITPYYSNTEVGDTQVETKGGNFEVIEIKTYTELKTLFNENKFTKADGSVINCEFVEEVTYPETSFEIGLSDTLFQGSQNTIPTLSNNNFGQNQSNSNEPKFQVRKGQIFIDPLGDELLAGAPNVTAFANPNVIVENVVINTPEQLSVYFPNIINGIEFQTKYYNSYSQDVTVNGETIVRHKFIRNETSKVFGLGIDTESDTLYRYVGTYDDNRNRVYSHLGVTAVQGRKFKVLLRSEVESNDNTNNVSNIDDTINAKYSLALKDAGYLRGYTPIGADIWFLPTSVKQIFIKEFEDFVGDFNNYDSTSELDQILKIIDPLNFPTTKVENKFNIFSQELTYPNMIEEFGSKLSDAPTIFKPISEDDKFDFGDNIDSDGLSQIPQPLLDWKNLYLLGVANKSTDKEFNSNGGFTYKVQKTNVGFTGVADIYNLLFNSYYILTSSTPRTFAAEFPLKETSSGELVETVNDYFRFSKQEMLAFTKGFVEEMRTANIAKSFQDKIKSDYEAELNAEALGANQDDDIRLSVYRSFKVLYDKWISASNGDELGKQRFFNPIGPDRLLIDHFSFVDRINNDIGDRALVDLDVVLDLFNNTTNSIFGVSSDVCDKSNFNFFPLASYVDLTAGINKYAQDNNLGKDDVISRMFTPLYEQDTFSQKVKNMGGPHFLAQYVGGNSQELDLSIQREDSRCLTSVQLSKGAKLEKEGDGFNLQDDNNPLTEGDVVGFKVAFGSQRQSHFQGLNLDQAEYKATQESLIASDMLANQAKDGGSGGFVAKSQSLYPIFLNRSYSCTVEGLGNMMIQPLQYFQLENVPMFYGAYLIREVKHNIRPHHMKTTFTGDRVPRAVVPIVEDFISTFKLKPTQSSGNRKSISSGGSSSGGGSFSSTGSKPSSADGFVGRYACNAYVSLRKNGISQDQILEGTLINKTLITQAAEQALIDWDNGKKKENEASQLKFLKQYAEATGNVPSAEQYASNAQAWSAAFTSYIMLQADPDFPESTGHWVYQGAATKGKAGYEVLPLSQGYKINPEIGDLFCNKRSGPNGTNSHCDIIYKIENGTAFLIGGNTSDFENSRSHTVGRKRINLSSEGYITDESKVGAYRLIVRKTGNKYHKKVNIQTLGDCSSEYYNSIKLPSDNTTQTSTESGDYGINDYKLFTYMAWQQGPTGSAIHYSLWKRNGKYDSYPKTKVTNKNSSNFGKFKYLVNIKSNWPTGLTAKNGVKESDVDKLFNNGVNKSGSHNKLAEAFVDVQRQNYSKRFKQGTNLLNSSDSNKAGVPYSKIKKAFEEYQSGPEADFDALTAFGTIENFLETDTKKSATFKTMFQMNKDTYKDTLAKIKKSDGRNKDYENWDIDTLVAVGVPKIKEAFASFEKKSGFS